MRKGRKAITLPAGILILLFTLMPLGGCQQENEGFQRRLTIADSLMRTDADSAFRMLCSMDSLASRMPKSQQMEHLLLRCNAQNKSDSLFTSDSLGLLLTRYFDRKGTPNQRMLAHYVLGCAYRDMGDSPSALRCFNEAVAAADTSDASSNIRQLSIIYGQMGSMYSDYGMIDASIHAFRQAEYYATQLKDSLRLYNIWSNLSESLYCRDSIEQAIQLKEKAAKGYQAASLHHRAARTLNICIEWMAKRRNWKKAKDFIDIYERLSGYVSDNGDAMPGHESYYVTKAVYYMEMGNLDSAKHLLYKFQPFACSIKEKYYLAWELSQLYEKMGNMDSVAKYAHEGDALHNLLYDEDVSNGLQKIQSQYDYARHERLSKYYQRKSEDKQYVIYYVLFASAMIVGMTIVLFILRWKSVRKTLSIMSGQIGTLRSEMVKKESHIIAQHQDADALQNKIDLYEHKLMTNADRKDRVLKDKETVRKFFRLAKESRDLPSDADWQSLSYIICRIYPSFRDIQNMKNLTNDDYKVCMLCKLSMSLRQMSFLVGKSEANLSMIRKRLLTKVFGETAGGAQEFDRRIQGLL